MFSDASAMVDAYLDGGSNATLENYVPLKKDRQKSNSKCSTLLVDVVPKSAILVYN